MTSVPRSGSSRLPCRHEDVRYFEDQGGAVACCVCGRLFGHLRVDNTFVSHNPGPPPNLTGQATNSNEAYWFCHACGFAGFLPVGMNHGCNGPASGRTAT